MKGRYPARKVFIFLWFRDIKCANKRIRANLAISDGWNWRPGSRIQRWMPSEAGRNSTTTSIARDTSISGMAKWWRMW